jgi:hypothetical protein
VSGDTGVHSGWSEVTLFPPDADTYVECYTLVAAGIALTNNIWGNYFSGTYLGTG